MNSVQRNALDLGEDEFLFLIVLTVSQLTQLCLLGIFVLQAIQKNTLENN